MKTALLSFTFLCIAWTATAQQNLLVNGSFEDYKAGYTGFTTISSGKATGMSGKWQAVIAKGGCPNGCGHGTATVIGSGAAAGTNAFELKIDSMVNRNDIRLFQSIEKVPAGVYEISFYAKSSTPAPLSVDALKSTQQSTNNGAEPFMGLFNLTTEWKKYTFTVDLGAWTDEERNEMRISLRPNSHKALPVGPYPKTFWFDDITLVKK